MSGGILLVTYEGVLCSVFAIDLFISASGGKTRREYFPVKRVQAVSSEWTRGNLFNAAYTRRWGCRC